jgi:hypothetical protein
MPQMLTLATAGALSIAGIVAGAQLGRSAVGEIDPFFFSQLPQSRFFADLVPAGYDPKPVAELSDVDEVWANNLNVSGRPECFDCGNFVEDVDLTSAPENAASTAQFEVAHLAPAPETREYMPRDVERYAYFPVTQEEAARPRPTAASGSRFLEQAVSDAGEEPELLNM